MERMGSELPMLIGQSGPLDGNRWIIGKVMTMGRDANCDIVIPARQVSRYHVELSPGENGVILKDLRSKNGTYCNGDLLDGPRTLEDGDILQVALVQEFAFLSSDATMPLGFGTPENTTEQENVGKLHLDHRSRRVWIGDSEILPPLSGPQFRMLHILYESQAKVVTRGDIIQQVWGDEESLGVSEQALDALVRRLRSRLRSIDSSHPYIVTVRGHGLRLDNPPV
jgi:pSer/pThr/pTyr-binding forkhead associated (FHA) protein